MKFNPAFNDINRTVTFRDIELFINEIRTKWKVNYYCNLSQKKMF